MDRIRARLVRIAALIFVLPVFGCAQLMNVQFAQGSDQGYTLVLNGIESAHVGHAIFAEGLRSGGICSKIEVVDWTTGTAALMLVHLRAENRNRCQAARIAAKIVQYQDQFPGRPVNLIGHSGGGAMVLMTLEALPQDRQVDSAILLAAAISPDYDLRPALCKVRRGIWNFSSVIGDSPLLVAGTTIFGTVDGRHSPSAGAVGFRRPCNLADQCLYNEKLIEQPYRLRMACNGNLSGHYGPMHSCFARNELAPILLWDGYPTQVLSQANWSH